MEAEVNSEMAYSSSSNVYSNEKFVRIFFLRNMVKKPRKIERTRKWSSFIINSYSSRTRRIWADMYNQRGRRPSWLSAHIRQVREE